MKPTGLVVEQWPVSGAVRRRQIEYWSEVAAASPRDTLDARIKWMERKRIGDTWDNVLRLPRCFFGSVLELGAGCAWASALISRMDSVTSVTVLDLVPELLQRDAMPVLRHLRARLDHVRLVAGDAHDLKLEDASIDVVVCDASLCHMDDLDRVLRECRRVLRSGGWMLSMREPLTEADRSEHGALQDVQRRLSREEWERSFLKAGFNVRTFLDFHPPRRAGRVVGRIVAAVPTMRAVWTRRRKFKYLFVIEPTARQEL